MPETSAALHFASPHWLWALLLLVPVAVWLMKTVRKSGNARIKDYADAHLLPHLLGTQERETRGQVRHFMFWALLWVSLVLAMAGPRWDYKEIQLFSSQNSLVVMLDISRSMRVADVQPSRFSRARQELEDLLQQAQNVRIGLIAFASVAHVISPVTEDLSSIRRILPALSTDLVRLQGSRLVTALERATQLIEGQSKEGGRALLIISDGDFSEPGLEDRIKVLSEQGIRVHVLGIGTPAGGWVPEPDRPIRAQVPWKPVLSRLDESRLGRLADSGRGIYQTADFLATDTQNILDAVMQHASVRTIGDSRIRIWEEYFFWLVGLVCLLLISQVGRVKLLGIVSRG